MQRTDNGRKSLGGQPRRTWFISLRWKLLIGFTILFSVVFAAAFYWFYTFSTDTALQKIQEDLLNTISGASAQVSGDDLIRLHEVGQPNGKGSSDDPLYTSIMDQLDAIHAIEPRAWPYVYIRGKSTHEAIFLADLQSRYNPDRAAPFLYAFENPEKAVPGLEALTLHRDDKGNFDIYADEWGRWVSAYAPIKNAKGELVGAMGIDFEAGYVDQVRQSILSKVFLAFIITYATLFLLVFLVTNALTRPIQSLTLAAERIGEGDYQQDLSQLSGARVRDEIGKLADVFMVMVGKVYQREQTLIRQVEELRIEIDETKKKNQVSEIVDSEFFRDLQSRADEMRKRRRQSGTSDIERENIQEPAQ